ncbi:hypothetical protein CJF32_00006185 [Rutstroemia sp. NJR-2017a WRK4]|nr:hypothetical protein CJF32_00006185 [Rutstroemia sp. NJR-2017a WRK4]
MTPPARAMTSRQRLLLGSIFGGGSLFIAMKWKAVMQRSEAAKVAGARENYFVVPGRSVRRYERIARLAIRSLNLRT